MSYHYSDPNRESEPTALPNVEVWSAPVLECVDCTALRPADCDACDCGDREATLYAGGAPHWWYAFGLPGCLHDGDPVGPFDTEAEALASARERNDE